MNYSYKILKTKKTVRTDKITVILDPVNVLKEAIHRHQEGIIIKMKMSEKMIFCKHNSATGR